MSLECTHLNPLQRDGTSQRKRMLEALKPDYIKVDEREIQDWILYARKYAELLQYYNKQNVADGNWVLFIEKDISTLVAMVSRTDTAIYKSRFEAAVQKAEAAESQAESAVAFAEILAILYEMAEKISDWYANAIPELSLHKSLSRLIAARLDDAFALLLKWLMKAEELVIPLVKNGLPPVSLNRRRNSWPNAKIPVAIEAFPKGIPDRKKETDRELFHLDRLFKRFFEVMHAIVAQAPAFLEETFTSYPEHQPHIALFLAFLNLMKVARDNMNTLTKRHLDFYYKEVLQLKNRPEDPDEVHIIFELANNFENHKIDKDTQFDAGDDGTGEQLIYAADNEIVVNRAVLDEEHGLKSIFLQLVDANNEEEQDHAPVRNIFAASDADLLGPDGEENKDPFEQWELLGSGEMPYGEVGFAVSSPMLLLGEGSRKINITFRFNNLQETLIRYGRSRIKSELKNNVKVYLSGEEDWVLVENREIEIITDGLSGLSPQDDRNAFGEISWILELDSEAPPIIYYDEEIHQRGLDTRFPTALFVLDNEGLSTLGDLELNLAGGVAEFEDSAYYLKNEFVFDTDEQSGVRKVYQSQVESIGTEFDSDKSLWEKVDLDPDAVDEYDENATYEVGQVVLFEGRIYRANAATGPPNSIRPVIWTTVEVAGDCEEKSDVPGLEAPDNAKKIWEIKPPSLKEFDITETYGKGDIVTYKDAIYQVQDGKTEVLPIAPLLGNDINQNYLEVEAFRASPPYNRGDIVAVNIVRDPVTNRITSADYYRALTNNNSGITPGTQAANGIWREIDPYDPNQAYSPEDMVTSLGAEDSSGNTVPAQDAEVFEAKFGMTGIGPLDLLQDLAWKLTDNYSPTQEYTAGVSPKVFHEATNAIYIPAEGTFSGITPDTNELPFKKVPTYGPSVEFGTLPDFDTHAEIGGILYECKIAYSRGIDPASGDKGWRDIKEYDYALSYGHGTRVYHTFTSGTTAAFINNTGGPIDPSNLSASTPIDNSPEGAQGSTKWTPITTVIGYDTTNSTRYFDGQIVRIGSTTGFYIAEGDTQGSDPRRLNDTTYKIWDSPAGTLHIYDENQNLFMDPADPQYKFFKQASTTNIYETLIKFKQISLGTRSLWTPLPATIYPSFDPNRDYLIGEYVTDANVNPHVVYEALKITRGYQPPDGTGNPSGTALPFWEPVATQGVWDDQRGYNTGDIIELAEDSGRFFEALTDVQGILGDAWVQVEMDDENYLYNPEETYSPGTFIIFENLMYQVGPDGIGIDQLAPNQNSNCWINISTLAEFDALIEYLPGNFVRYQGQIFEACAISQGVAPGLGLYIWEPVDESSIKPFDPDKFYSIGQYVSIVIDEDETTCYYRSSAGIEGISPATIDSKNFWRKLPYYSYDSPPNNDTINHMGDLVQLGSLVYKAIADTNQKPGPANNSDWEEITDFLIYSPDEEYEIGNIVLHQGFYYETIQLGETIAPGSTPNFWEARICTAPYSAVKSFVPGEYIEFQGKFYRPLGEIFGDDPLTSPDLWQEVGLIRDYTDDATYYVGFHVRHNGQVFRALKTVNKIAPDDERAEEFWVLVPGSYPYNYFYGPELEKLEIVVDVTGMKNPILENDGGTIIAGKPFNPFGAVPKVGSKFYLGSQEIFQKSLKEISLRFEWGDLPFNNGVLDFSDHYNYYHFDWYEGDNPSPIPNPVPNNAHFKMAFNFLIDGIWRGSDTPYVRTNDTVEIFESVDNVESDDDNKTFAKTYSLNFDQSYFRRDPQLDVFEQFRNGMPRGFMRLGLLNDFFHARYPIFLSKAAIQAANGPSGLNPLVTDRFPNEPYTPLISDLTVSYKASETITYKSKTVSDMQNRVERLFHIYPFGQKEFFPIKADTKEGPISSLLLVPKFEGKKVVNEEGKLDPFLASGNFYMGVNNLDLPQNLNVLFQVAEGSEDPDFEIQRVTWSYLSKDRWIDFTDTEIISDTTNGLLTSGIISFSLPKEMSNNNTSFPTGIYWIKASIVDHPEAIAKALAVIPQAVQASYRKQENNDPLHLQKPLPADTITALLSRQAGISSVSQPFASFGGRLGEQDEEFYIRISERLRHKARGITIYDYERLVLQEFPQVYKAKCINHSQYGNDINPNEVNEIQAGKVSVVVISDLRNKNAVNKLRPILSVNTRLEIQEFLERKTSCFANIEVISPLFEEVKVETKVEFMPGLDKGFYTKQLQKDIVRFLAPWLFDEEAELVFGNKMTASALINFIDEQNYVDFITDMVLYHRIDENETFKKVKGDEVLTCSSASVLVPAPEEAHKIIPNIEEKCLT